jgi:hypothetical protein
MVAMNARKKEFRILMSLLTVPILDGVENVNRNDYCDFGFITQALCFYNSDRPKST